MPLSAPGGLRVRLRPAATAPSCCPYASISISTRTLRNRLIVARTRVVSRLSPSSGSAFGTLRKDVHRLAPSADGGRCAGVGRKRHTTTAARPTSRDRSLPTRSALDLRALSPRLTPAPAQSQRAVAPLLGGFVALAERHPKGPTGRLSHLATARLVVGSRTPRER